MANIGDYASSYASFEWGPPERFNFGRDVIDGSEEDRPAMTWLGTSGEERRLTFGDFSRLSSKFRQRRPRDGCGPRRQGDGPPRQGPREARYPHRPPQAQRKLMADR
jgi:hypothetical protein